MKLLLENWREYINEEEWEPSGDKIMFPAKYLFSHMGEYRTEKYWTDFKKLSEEEKIEWAKKVKFDEPIQVTVFADGSFGHGDGHHRAMAGKILDIDVPIIITRNKVKEKSEDLWETYLSRIRQGSHPKELNPEQYNMKSIEQMGWDSQDSAKDSYYHGGGKDFLPTKIGTFYSKDRAYAEKYAAQHKDGRIAEVEIDLSQAKVYPKVFWWQEFQGIWQPEKMFRGYDIVKVIEPNGEEPSIVVLNPKLVAIKEG